MALAETLGSAASMLITDMDKNIVVGMEVKGNHLKQVNEGFVTGKATPVHQGKLTHLWNVDIFNEANELTATCRITNIILEKEQG